MDRVYWDTREHRGDLTDEPVYDVKVMYEWSSDLPSLVRKVEPAGMGEFLDLDRRCTAYMTAAQEGRVDPEIVKRSRLLIPDDLFWKYAHARHTMAAKLFALKGEVERKAYEKTTYPNLRMIREIEKNGIHIDTKLLQEFLRKKDLAVHERAFMQGTSDRLQEGDLVFSKITPVGTRTGRFGVESGFPAMAVPHGVCREVITSRFSGGSITTLDFNAIDYRCIVESLGNNGLREFYRGERDFHARTASYIEADRDVTKKVTYTHLYGGSKKTLLKQTLLSEEKIDNMLFRLDGLFQSISSAREKMAKAARECGYVFTPSGEKVEVLKDDHDGKVIGLYAQRYSSEVFSRALGLTLDHIRRIQATSRVIFTVHDEIVIDQNGIGTLCESIAKEIEEKTGFVVKLTRGKNYAEATN